eukprot:SAG11_NODE_3655_length_2306_cov_1.716357_2_plen_161_part_00
MCCRPCCSSCCCCCCCPGVLPLFGVAAAAAAAAAVSFSSEAHRAAQGAADGGRAGRGGGLADGGRAAAAAAQGEGARTEDDPSAGKGHPPPGLMCLCVSCLRCVSYTYASSRRQPQRSDVEEFFLDSLEYVREQAVAQRRCAASPGRRVRSEIQRVDSIL